MNHPNKIIEQKIQDWRLLSPAQQLAITLEALPKQIAMSMAMAGEPVPISVISRQRVKLMAERAYIQSAKEVENEL